MPEIKVQRISHSLFVCLPKELLDGGPDRAYAPLDIDVGDTIKATRTLTGILFEPMENYGSTWMRVPIRR